MRKFLRKNVRRNQPRRKFAKLGGKRKRNNKAPLRSRKRSRKASAISSHIASYMVKEDVVVNHRKKSGRPKNQSTNLYYVAPTGVQLSTVSLKQGYGAFYAARNTDLKAALATTGTAPAGGWGSVSNTNKTYFQTHRQEFMFTNNTSSTSMIKIMHYDCVNDTATGFITQWVGGMQDAQGNLTDNTNAYNIEPSMSPAIKQFWKQKKWREYTLAPGATLKHVWVTKINKFINNELLDDGDVYMRGVTQCMLVIVRGTAGSDGTNAALVNITPAKIDVAYTQTISYTYVPDYDNNLLINGGSNTGAVGNGVTVINTTGAVTQNITAAGF